MKTTNMHTPGVFGTVPTQCGCATANLPEGTRIVFCPTHAAAPELLELLKQSMEALQDYIPGETPLRTSIKKAIAKAEGR